MTHAEALARAILDGSARDEDIKELARLAAEQERWYAAVVAAGDGLRRTSATLREELENALSERDRCYRLAMNGTADNHELTAERDKLRAENEALRERLAKLEAFADRLDALDKLAGEKAEEHDGNGAHVLADHEYGGQHAIREAAKEFRALVRAGQETMGEWDPFEGESTP